jgi:hypothetical protein
MRTRTRSLYLLLAIVAGGLGFLGYGVWRDHAAAAAQREQVFAAVERLLAAGDRNAAELSVAVAQLHKLDAGDHDVALALARIELLRGHCEAAARLLEPLLLGGAGHDEYAAAAQAWLGWQLTGGRDHGERQELLRQALRYAESAHAAGGDAKDLYLAWTAAVRLDDAAERQRLGEQLQQQHADSLPARTAAALARAGDLDQPIGPVDKLVAEWDAPPVELRLLQAALLLQQHEIARSTAILDELLAAAPNLIDVRHCATLAHHVAFLTEADEKERARHAAVRDAQIGWLDANAPPDDGRRPSWLAMRQQH